MDTVNDVLKSKTGKPLLTEEQWREREGNLINRNGLDQVLHYGWEDLTAGQKIAIGQMREAVREFEKLVEELRYHNCEERGRVKALERTVDMLVDKMLLHMDKTGRL